jgi:hypothetical protein
MGTMSLVKFNGAGVSAAKPGITSKAAARTACARGAAWHFGIMGRMNTSEEADVSHRL